MGGQRTEGAGRGKGQEAEKTDGAHGERTEQSTMLCVA